MATQARNTRTARKATPRKAAPAPAPAPAASNGKGFDFGSLSVGSADVLPSSGKRGMDLAKTPFPDAVEASWAEKVTRTVSIKGVKVDREYGSVKTVTIPASVAKKTERLIRRAGDHLDGVGVRVVPGDPDENGNVTIAFRAQTRRAGSE